MPETDAREHSALVSRNIRRRIVEAGGWIDFADYMDLALYAPGLGYYSAGAQKFGESGDFVTAPEISPLFARCLARTLVDQAVGGSRWPSILELGAGTGSMAAGILQTLQRLNALPERYLILEVSADLRQRQQHLIAERVPDLIERVTWLDALPSTPIEGAIIANEVLDALPVTRFVIDENNHAQMLGVKIVEPGFAESRRPPTAEFQSQIQAVAGRHAAAWPNGYTSEFCPAMDGLIGSLSTLLQRGLILLIDYGFSQQDYYRPERSSGTLSCHYRHRMHADPFFYPGLQDITAWVDFTRVADVASVAGLDVLGFTTQAHFLLAAGIQEEFALLSESAESAADSRLQHQIASGLKTLMMPGQMGETFKVMALGRGMPRGPDAVCAKDLLHLL